MKIALRLIALLAALTAIATIVFVVHLGDRGFLLVSARRLLGPVTFAGWLIAIVAGPIAAVQLFRLRRSGRVAAIILFGTMALYYGAGIAGMRADSSPTGPIISAFAFFTFLVIVLLLPAARKACRPGPAGD